MKNKIKKKISEVKSKWNQISLKLRTQKGCCEMCGSEKHLSVHHIAYKRQYKSLYFEEKNLIVLCRKHHLLAHLNPTYFLSWFQEHFPERWNWLKNFILTYKKEDDK